MMTNKDKKEKDKDNITDEEKKENVNFGQNDDLVAGEQFGDDLSPPEDLNLKLQIEKENSIALTKMLQQLQADFSNYRKRNANLATESKQKGIYDAVNALLPTLDALMSASKHIADQDTLKGLKMVEKEFLNSLKSLDIEQIETIGCQYDPNLHNVIVAEECEGVPSGQIIEEIKPGFKSPTGIVRVAMVKIAK